MLRNSNHGLQGVCFYLTFAFQDPGLDIIGLILRNPHFTFTVQSDISRKDIMSRNKGAYQPSQGASALEVRDGTQPQPGSGQIVIRNHAVAINPVDMWIQSRGNIMYTWLKYPFVIGYDMAGEVAQVGKDVKHFKVGDRVLALSRAADQEINDSAHGAFQEYAVAYKDLTTPIPESLEYEQAATLPLGVATALTALFDDSQLGLQPPKEPRQKATGETVIIWGGSTSVGCNAIQLAVAAGYEVFSTASPRNHEMLRKLGATKVWDYNSNTVDEHMVSALKGKKLVGAISIGAGAADKCISIVDKCQGRKFVSMVTFPVPQGDIQSFVLLRTVVPFLLAMISFKVRSIVKGFKYNFVAIGSSIKNGVAQQIFTDYLPKALEAGTFVPSPEPEVVGHGLENVQVAFELLRKGVSAKKLVVTL